MAVFPSPLPFHRPHIPRAPRPGTPRPRVLPRPRTVRRTAAHDRTLGRDLAVPLGAVAAALLATALLLTGSTGHATRTAVALAVFALLTLLVSALARPLLMPAVALVSWMFYDGFVLHQRSDLAFQQPDRTGLLVLLLAGAAGAGCAAAVRSLRRRRTS
ncbi:DUF4118 domain-containing protein [Streptomyces lydicus]|uniref:DUF4118 domain-containing protein n=1 Tax=Streptomyces lydicus TaxID=47763 RepID=UPI0036AB6E97